MVASHGVSIIAEVVVTERGVLFKGAAGMRPAWCVIWIDVEAHTPPASCGGGDYTLVASARSNPPHEA